MRPREKSQTFVFVMGTEVGYARGGGDYVFFPIRIGNLTRKQIEQMTDDDFREAISDHPALSKLERVDGKVKIYGVMVRNAKKTKAQG